MVHRHHKSTLTHQTAAKATAKATEHSTKIQYYSVDVTSVEDVRARFDQATANARFPLRGLVTCAGISGGGPSLDFSVDEMKRIMDINVMGTFVCAQAAAREFQKHNVPGSIVLIASMSGHGSNKVCCGIFF